MRVASTFCVVTLLLGQASTRTAYAEPPASPPAVPGAAPAGSAGVAPQPTPVVAAPSSPDVVILKNGGMLRGTIGELNPNAAVTIITVTGATHPIPMGEV